MLFTVQRSPRRYELHLGTLWDFVRARDRTPRGLLLELIRGLIAIGEAARHGSIPMDAVISGFIYFLRPATMNRFGFKVRRPRALEMLGFALSYAETCVLTSIVKRRVVFVNPRNTWIIETTVAQIAAAQTELARLRDSLERSKKYIKPCATVEASVLPNQRYLRAHSDV